MVLGLCLIHAVPPSDSFGFETGPDDIPRTEGQLASSPNSLYASLPAPVSGMEREFQSPMPDDGEIVQCNSSGLCICTDVHIMYREIFMGPLHQ